MKKLSLLTLTLSLLSTTSFANSICLVSARDAAVVAVCDGKLVASQEYGAWPDSLVQKSLVLKQLTDQGYDIVSEVMSPSGAIEYTLKR